VGIRDNAIRWLEVTLLEFATETGGSCDASTVKRTTLHILDSLARNYVDLIVEEACRYWNIEYRRAHISAPGDGGGNREVNHAQKL
jgi:hypothetical protein